MSRYKTVQREGPPYNPEMRKALHEIAARRRRFGYRRIGLLPEPKGMLMNPEKLSRLHREEGLTMKRR